MIATISGRVVRSSLRRQPSLRLPASDAHPTPYAQQTTRRRQCRRQGKALYRLWYRKSTFVSADVPARAFDWLRDKLLSLKMIIFLLNQYILLSPDKR